MTRRAEAMIMTLNPGEATEDQPANEHPRCEQWMFVLSGSGSATVISKGKRRTAKLRPGSLLVIERGERHQIRASGARPLRALNFYVPPAYTKSGDLKKAAKKST